MNEPGAGTNAKPQHTQPRSLPVLPVVLPAELTHTNGANATEDASVSSPDGVGPSQRKRRRRRKSRELTSMRLRIALMVHEAPKTCDEIEAAFQLTHQTVSPRVYELARAGLLVQTSETRLTRSGSPANVYRWAFTEPPTEATVRAALSNEGRLAASVGNEERDEGKTVNVCINVPITTLRQLDDVRNKRSRANVFVSCLSAWLASGAPMEMLDPPIRRRSRSNNPDTSPSTPLVPLAPPVAPETGQSETGQGSKDQQSTQDNVTPKDHAKWVRDYCRRKQQQQRERREIK